MSAKNYIVKPGQNVTIEVNRRKVPSSKSQVSSLKGIIKTRKEDDYQARRLSGGILFFDLGLTFADEIYLDVDSQVITDWTTGGGIPSAEPLTDADFAARDIAAIANIETTAQIKTVYTEFVGLGFEFDGEFVPLDATTSAWTNKGFAIKPAQLAAEDIYFFANSVYFDSFQIKGAGANKITTENNPDADAAEYHLRATDKFYLVPTFCHSVKQENFVDHLGFYSFNQQLNSFYLFFPRVPYLTGGNSTELDGKDLPNSRVMRSTTTEFGGAFTNSEHPGSVYESDATNSISHGLSDDTPADFLVAVIKQGENTFYVWKD